MINIAHVQKSVEELVELSEAVKSAQALGVFKTLAAAQAEFLYDILHHLVELGMSYTDAMQLVNEQDLRIFSEVSF